MPQTLRITFVAALIAGLSGCAAYRADPLDATVELDVLRSRDLRHFVVERATPGQSPGAANHTFDVSDGLDEAEVVAVALELNPDLRAERAEVGEAQAVLIAAGLWPNPEIGVGLRPGINGAAGMVVEADAIVQLLRLGERNARKKAAEARANEIFARRIAAEFKLVSEVRKQRLAVLAAERTEALLREAVALRQRGLDLVRHQREIGEATTLAVAATELELVENRRDLRNAQSELAMELCALNRLLGLPPDYELKLTEMGAPLAVTVFEDLPDEELDRRLLAGRVELRATEAAYHHAEQELRLAVLRQYPRLGVGPGVERELAGDTSLGLALSLELPLLNRNQGEIAEKRAARQRMRAQYTALLHRLRAEAFAARATVRRARIEVEIQEREIQPLLHRSQELFDAAYRAREISIIDWITAQQRAVNARRSYLDALVRYRQAVIQLETAMGQPLQ